MRFKRTSGARPYEPHQPMARSGQNGLVYNLDIEAVATPELVRWSDDLHD